MVMLGAGGYYPDKNQYKKRIVKAPKGYRVWFSQPTNGGKEVEIVYYRPKKMSSK